MLQALHDRKNGQIAEFKAPEGSGLPTEMVTILPYYMNSQDHAKYGFWKFKQEGQRPVYIYSQEPWGEQDSSKRSGANMRLSHVLDITKLRSDGELDPEREAEVVDLLRLASDACNQQVAARAAQVRARRGLGRLFLPRQKHA